MSDRVKMIVMIITLVIFVPLLIGSLVFSINKKIVDDRWSGPREENWAWELGKKCKEARGEGEYNKQTNIYACWNKNYFGGPKLVFTETFK